MLCDGRRLLRDRRPQAPAGLRAFVYRADEAVKADHTYAQMPAFAWNAVRGAAHYELQIATSRSFVQSTSVYDNASLAVPVASVQLQLPWMTGKPFALWARVRDVSGGRTSAWSAPFGFNTAWQQVPQQEPAPEGLIRWTPVEGATSYQVWYLNLPAGYASRFSTFTNVADEREYWTLHPADAAVIRWRVRAVRLVQSGSLPDGIAVTSYGPYSPVYTTTNPTTLPQGPITGVAADSDDRVDAGQATGASADAGLRLDRDDSARQVRASAALLSRVYVFSDKQCVNPVMTGSIVGGPAWAPRNGDPLALPGTDTELQEVEQSSVFLGYGAADERLHRRRRYARSRPRRPTATARRFGQRIGHHGSERRRRARPAPRVRRAAASSARLVSLPDIGWPQGRYWWTVVPVAIVDARGPSPRTATAAGTLEYHDLELPQDACAAGQVWPFGMQSSPVTTTSQTPYASGVVAGMRVVSAASQSPGFLEQPLVSWQPALGATTYEIELSRKLYPWKAVTEAGLRRQLDRAAADEAGRRHVVLPGARGEPGSRRPGADDGLVGAGRDPHHRRPFPAAEVGSAA